MWKGLSGQSRHLFLAPWRKLKCRQRHKGPQHSLEYASLTPRWRGPQGQGRKWSPNYTGNQEHSPGTPNLTPTFSTYPCKQLISLVPPGSMFLTSQEKQSSVFQRRKKCRAATPNFSYTHHQFWICTRSLRGGKNSISFEQSITF